MTGWLQQRRQYRQYKDRIAHLPENYREAVHALERYINHVGGLGDASSILVMLDDLADLVERAAADGTTIRQLLGEDPVEFADAFLRNYPAGQWIARERSRLTESIDRLAADER